MLIVYGFLFFMVGPFVHILVIIIWLILLVRFELLTSWLEESKITVDEKKRITRNVTRILLGFEFFGTPFIMLVFYYLLIAGKMPDVIAMFLYSPTCFVLAVQGWMILLSYFGLSLWLKWLGISVNRYEQIHRNVVTTILCIGIFISLGSFIGWIYTINTNWDRVGGLYFGDVIILSPMTTFLAIGLTLAVPFSLVEASPLKQGDSNYERLAKILLLVFVLLSVGGAFLSIYPFLSGDSPCYL